MYLNVAGEKTLKLFTSHKLKCFQVLKVTKLSIPVVKHKQETSYYADFNM